MDLAPTLGVLPFFLGWPEYFQKFCTDVFKILRYEVIQKFKFCTILFLLHFYSIFFGAKMPKFCLVTMLLPLRPKVTCYKSIVGLIVSCNHYIRLIFERLKTTFQSTKIIFEIFFFTNATSKWESTFFVTFYSINFFEINPMLFFSLSKIDLQTYCLWDDAAVSGSIWKWNKKRNAHLPKKKRI